MECTIAQYAWQAIVHRLGLQSLSGTGLTAEQRLIAFLEDRPDFRVQQARRAAASLQAHQKDPAGTDIIVMTAATPLVMCHCNGYSYPCSCVLGMGRAAHDDK